MPTPSELKAALKPSAKASAFIARSRRIHQEILEGTDRRKVFVLGPCSIHHMGSALEYARRLEELGSEVAETSVLVMRVYTEKPRTATGWKGFLYDPYLDSSGAIETGLFWARKLLLTLAEKGIACATEFVDPLVAPYLEDLITWGFIGARTSSSQPHRQLASALEMPVGFKNSIDGNIECAIDAVVTSAESHIQLTVGQEGKVSAMRSLGNPHTHIVLRGSHGGTNYDALSVSEAVRGLEKKGLPPRIMIDCSHGNAQKLAEKQCLVFESVLRQGSEHVFGLMLESHLEAGQQSMEGPIRAELSLTDPCLDWETTSELIRGAHALLQDSSTVIRLTQS